LLRIEPAGGFHASARSGFRRSRDEGGAQAVEFALLCLILFPLLLGIIQFGLFFNDYLQVRQGAREGARTGVVRNFQTCAGAVTEADKIRCYTKRVIAPTSGTPAVRVLAPSGWATGKRLVVCATVKTADIAGLVPMPQDGFVRAKTEMSIEQGTPAPTGTFPSSDTDPSGQNWSWCT
jgi:hypothetical protein